MTIRALADDLTGALEVGAKFAASGARAVVYIRQVAVRDAPVAVVDTETRHLAPQAAAAIVRGLAAAARQSGADIVYMKTDSTLRGNIGAELSAAMEAFPGVPLFYGPAYPQLGRTVRDGRLYVRGIPVHETDFANDPLNPVRESSIFAVVRAQCGREILAGAVSQVGAASETAIHIFDSHTEEDVGAIARAVLERQPPILLAGPAGFAAAIAGCSPGAPREPWPSVRSCLVVNGSLHEASRRQVAHAVFDNSWTLLATAGNARSTGIAVRNVLRRTPFPALTVFGGDTAFGILIALGGPPLWPLGELLPGVPISRFRWEGRELYLISKAGGFGPPDVLARIRRLLEAR